MITSSAKPQAPGDIFVSIIIPVKQISDYLREETIPALLKQTYQNFEIIILPDKPAKEKFPKTRIIPSWPKVGPADKRDLGVKKAKGEIIAFIDDDAYPSKKWLENALFYFKPQASSLERIAAVCGPGVTPPSDPLLAQISGWMWSSWLGAGGAGTYRCWPGKRREVDDFPTFNLIVRKSDFKAVGGFDSRFWPGEDTKFCHDLVYKLKKKIIYDPEVLVYHHRRNIFIPHLKQIGRYGLHRGHFVKILPKTSKRLGYFIPLLFTLGVLLTPPFYLFLKLLGLVALAKVVVSAYLGVLGIYGILLLLTAIWVFWQSRSILIAFLVMPTIFISHLFYGIMFLRGLSKRVVRSKFDRERI
jgi:glycosyltransferase involved in cell wall biosynthesis